MSNTQRWAHSRAQQMLVALINTPLRKFFPESNLTPPTPSLLPESHSPGLPGKPSAHESSFDFGCLSVETSDLPTAAVPGPPSSLRKGHGDGVLIFHLGAPEVCPSGPADP